MRFRKEVKVGFLAVIGILMSVFSYNYLKGFNLFEKNRTFKIIYNKVDGLSGATITSVGVQHLVNYWLGSDAYGKFLENFRNGGLALWV